MEVMRLLARVLNQYLGFEMFSDRDPAGERGSLINSMIFRDPDRRVSPFVSACFNLGILICGIGLLAYYGYSEFHGSSVSCGFQTILAGFWAYIFGRYAK
jgi:hypothetical protein